ncbi:Putative epoxidase LasC [Coccomyxa sp. Obi]|nr:Putative epoxidase LasC [Coccomyxa sp. Obi]
MKSRRTFALFWEDLCWHQQQPRTLAAAAVAPYVDEVYVLDKENALNGSGSEEQLRKDFAGMGADLAERARMRKGVPQYIQPHGLLCRAAHSVELLLPGWQALAEQLGGKIVLPGRVKTFFKGRWTYHPDDNTGLITVGGSRALIEESIRARLLALRPNVRIVCGCRAIAPIWSHDFSSIGGVVTKDGREFRADLVIDAAGRRSPLPGWLVAGGYQPPKEVQVDPHVTYCAQLYKKPPQDGERSSFDVIYIRPASPVTRGGLLQSIENSLLLCCLWGYSGEHPPHDDQGYLEFAASLEQKDLYEAIKDAEPVTRAFAYSGMTNLRRLYEDIKLPGRLAVVGDSLAAYNPVYGQGISVAAIEAETLRKLLEVSPSPALSESLPPAQLLHFATGGEDLNFEGTTGERPKKGLTEKLMGSYLDALLDLAATDMAVFKSVQEVMNMMSGPESLVRPGLIAKALHKRILQALP